MDVKVNMKKKGEMRFYPPIVKKVAFTHYEDRIWDGNVFFKLTLIWTYDREIF